MKVGNQKKAGKSSVKWEKAPTNLTRDCVFMSIFGDTGTGKTTLALTAPGPIAFIHASEKIEGIIQPAAREKEIRVHNFGGGVPGKGGTNEIAKAADEVMAELKAAWVDAFGWARTIIVDTHTEIWDLLRLARFGTLTPRGHIASMYAPVNGEMRALFKEFRTQDTTNVITIGTTKESYRNDKPTGKMVMAGFKEVPYYSDVIIEMTRPGFMKKSETDFTATIRKGWWNATVEGLEIDDETITFPFLMSLITETEEEKWEE